MNPGNIRRLLAVAAAMSLVAALGISTVLASPGAPAARVSNIGSAIGVHSASPADTDNVQGGDQTTPDMGAGADPVGDPLAQGPDLAGSENELEDAPAAAGAATTSARVLIVAAKTSVNANVTQRAKSTARLAFVRTADPAGDANPQCADNGAEATSENAGDASGETAGETSSEAANDGPGGHEDPDGQDVQHEFQGEE